MLIYILTITLQRIVSDRVYTKNAILRLVKYPLIKSNKFDVRDNEINQEDKYKKIALQIHDEEIEVKNLFWEKYNEDQKQMRKNNILKDKIKKLKEMPDKSYDKQIKPKIDQLMNKIKEIPEYYKIYNEKLSKISTLFANYENNLTMNLYNYVKPYQELINTIRYDIRMAVLVGKDIMYHFEKTKEELKNRNAKKEMILNRYLNYIEPAKTGDIIKWIYDLPFFDNMINDLKKYHEDLVLGKQFSKSKNALDNIIQTIYNQIHLIKADNLHIAYINILDSDCNHPNRENRKKCLRYKRLSQLLSSDDIDKIMKE